MDIVAIPKATSRDHLAANVDIFDFGLTDSEMAEVSQSSILRTTSLFLRNETAP